MFDNIFETLLIMDIAFGLWIVVSLQSLVFNRCCMTFKIELILTSYNSPIRFPPTYVTIIKS